MSEQLIEEPAPVRLHVCRYQTLQLTEGEAKVVLDLLYAELAAVEAEYRIANFRMKKNWRARRKRVAFIINKFEGRTAVPHAMPEDRQD